MAKHQIAAILVGILLSALIGSKAVYAKGFAVQPWEHGFKTKLITATRYKMLEPDGYYIGLRYAASVDYQADRSEVFEFLEKNGCTVLKGGGEPMSEYMIGCKGVTDKDSANKKLLDILPKLSKFMQRLGAE